MAGPFFAQWQATSPFPFLPNRSLLLFEKHSPISLACLSAAASSPFLLALRQFRSIKKALPLGTAKLPLVSSLTILHRNMNLQYHAISSNWRLRKGIHPQAYSHPHFSPPMKPLLSCSTCLTKLHFFFFSPSKTFFHFLFLLVSAKPPYHFLLCWFTSYTLYFLPISCSVSPRARHFSSLKNLCSLRCSFGTLCLFSAASS